MPDARDHASKSRSENARNMSRVSQTFCAMGNGNTKSVQHSHKSMNLHSEYSRFSTISKRCVLSIKIHVNRMFAICILDSDVVKWIWHQIHMFDTQEIYIAESVDHTHYEAYLRKDLSRIA